MNWPWQIYFDYLATCCQICFKKVLTLCGCMRVYINSMHMLVTAWTSDKYFFLEVSILSVCLPVCLKPLWALVSIGIWWIEILCHWISIGTWTCQTVWCIKNCGHKLSDEWNDFQWNEILSVEFYSKRIDKSIVMSLCINFQLSTYQINWSVNWCTEICSNNKLVKCVYTDALHVLISTAQYFDYYQICKIHLRTPLSLNFYNRSPGFAN